MLLMFICVEFSSFTHDTQTHPFCKIFRVSGLVAKLYLTLEIWTVACQAPLSMEFFRQEYWSGLPFPFPGDRPNQGSNPGLLLCRQILYQLSYQGCVQHSHFPCVTTEHLKCEFKFRCAICVNAHWILETQNEKTTVKYLTGNLFILIIC